MLQKITMATTGFLSFTTPYLESSKGCGTRGHLTLGLVAIYSKVKGKLVLCVLGKFDRVPERLEPGLNPPLAQVVFLRLYKAQRTNYEFFLKSLAYFGYRICQYRCYWKSP